jgi:hypothetical protein
MPAGTTAALAEVGFGVRVAPTCHQFQ